MFTRQSISQSLTILAPVVIAVMILWLIISFAITHVYIRADGSVIQLIEKHSKDDVYYCPVVTFRDNSGVERVLHSSVGSNPPRFPVSSRVSVLYQAQHPDNGMIEDRFMLWTAPLILIAISIFYGAVGFIIGRWPRMNETRSAN